MGSDQIRTVAVILIIPDFKNQEDVELWEKSLDRAKQRYQNPDLEGVADLRERWATGYLAWRKLIETVSVPNIEVFFVRTDFRIGSTGNFGSCATREKIAYRIDDRVISVQHNSPCGFLIYKSLVAFDILFSRFDYLIRGNINMFLDLKCLSQFIQTLPTTKVFTSPFWEGGYYPYGYFMIFSQDIGKYLANLNLFKYRKWNVKHRADDRVLTKLILKRFDYHTISGCERPTPHHRNFRKNRKPSFLNHRGVIIRDTSTFEEFSKIVSGLPNSVFLYRIRRLSDMSHVKCYELLISRFIS